MGERLTCEDVVIVVPGILGSRLSRDGDEVWGVSPKAAVKALLTFGGSLKRLALPAGIGDADPEDGVVATGLMNDLQVVPGLWSPIRGYSGILDWLRETFTLDDDAHVHEGDPVNLVAFAYDWRLSNRLNAERLRDRVEPVLDAWRKKHPEARLVFLCHSMGGLVARRYLECLDGARVTRTLVTFGTPHRGSAKALDQLVNGRRQGWWKFQLDLTGLVRSLPSTYQLLPTYACVETAGASELRRLDEVDLPELDRDRVRDALAFHEEMRSTAPAPYRFEVVTGIEQPTCLSVRLEGREVVPLRTMAVLRDGQPVQEDPKGDGTVPRFSASLSTSDRVQANRVWRTEQHGSVHLNDAVLDHLKGVLTDTEIVFRGQEKPPQWIGLDLPDVVGVGEPFALDVEGSDDRLSLQAVVAQPDGSLGRPVPLTNLGGRRYRAQITLAQPGPHSIQVRASFSGAGAPPPVTGALLAWNPADETP